LSDNGVGTLVTSRLAAGTPAVGAAGVGLLNILPVYLEITALGLGIVTTATILIFQIKKYRLEIRLLKKRDEENLDL